MLVCSVCLFTHFVHECFLKIQQKKCLDTNSLCQPSRDSGSTAVQESTTVSAPGVSITDVLHFVSTQAFFVKDYIMNHPEDGEKIGRLRELMFEQVCKRDKYSSVLYILVECMIIMCLKGKQNK